MFLDAHTYESQVLLVWQQATQNNREAEIKVLQKFFGHSLELHTYIGTGTCA
jgi:hypothetical protein